MRYLFPLTIVFAIVFMTACEAESEEDLFPFVPVPKDTTTTGVTVTFSGDMLPLIRTKCATPGCHAANATLPALVSYEDINLNKDKIKNRAVDIGDMPDGGPELLQAEKDIIINWIAEGARNN